MTIRSIRSGQAVFLATVMLLMVVSALYLLDILRSTVMLWVVSALVLVVTVYRLWTTS